MELPPSSEVNADLDKARDEKVIPVAQEILESMVDLLLPENIGTATDAHDPLILKILQRALETDMNITTEAQYVFQLLLGAFGGLNTTLHALELTPTDEVRYLAIGRKILRILADAKVRMNTTTPEESQADFADAKVELQALVDEEKITALDLRHIMDTIFEAVKAVNNRVSEGLAQSMEKAEAKVFGVESMKDITVKHVNNVLIHDIQVLFSKPQPEAPPPGEVAPPAGDGQVAPPEEPPASEPPADPAA